MLELERLEIQQGEFSLQADISIPGQARVALIGPSGGGKSTLIGVIAGFVAPVSGRVLIGKRDMTGIDPGARPCSIIFQDGNLFPHLTLAQNVGLGIRPDLRLNSGQRTKVLTALARVGLEGFEDRKPGSLSGGQQSRAALARVFVQRKPLLLLDEPFAALGPAQRIEMLDLVAELCGETHATLVMVTHNPEDAHRIADLTVVVADGAVSAPAKTGEVFADPPAALANYLGRTVR